MTRSCLFGDINASILLNLSLCFSLCDQVFRLLCETKLFSHKYFLSSHTFFHPQIQDFMLVHASCIIILSLTKIKIFFHTLIYGYKLLVFILVENCILGNFVKPYMCKIGNQSPYFDTRVVALSFKFLSKIFS